MMMSRRSLLLLMIAGLPVLAARPCRAGSATWAESPISGNWNTAANWVPQTIPNGPGDTAFFGVSNVTNLTTSAITEVESIVFNPDAAPFNVTTSVGTSLTISGKGIINDSHTVQSFGLEVTDETGSALFFTNSATAGELILFNNPGSSVYFLDTSSAGKASFTTTKLGVRQGDLTFFDNATAAEATIATNGNSFAFFFDDATAGNAVFTTSDGGRVFFSTSSSAEQATVQCSGGTEPGLGGGGVQIDTSATAAQSNVTLGGADVAGAVSTDVTFSNSATGGTATFVVNGGVAVGAEGATMNLYEDSSADAASITINGGSNGGGGGALFFFVRSDGGTARVALYGNGQMDIGDHGKPGVTIGSLQGDGLVFLGPRILTIGSNNVDTTFSGVIQESGSLSKTGAGRLTLRGANTYTGGTTVSAGMLQVNNPAGSGTGTGPMQVNAGTLGGGGTIAGAVTVGSGSGAGSFLAPAAGTARKATLTLQSSLTLQSDATYTYTFKARGRKANTDEVIANGVTLNGAEIDLQGTTQGVLRSGLVLTLISNTAATPIAGVFGNLPDASTFTLGRNTFLVDYQGGDGNDLTLKVVP